jgi:hypothetical protein
MADLEAGSGKPEEDLPPALRRALERIDVKAQSAAQRIDVGRVADGTMRRLGDPAYGRTDLRAYGKRAAWVAAAAAAAIVVGVTLSRESPARLPVAMDSIFVADSQEVLAVVNEVAVADTALTASVVMVDDLNEQELRALLQALENEETL